MVRCFQGRSSYQRSSHEAGAWQTGHNEEQIRRDHLHGHARCARATCSILRFLPRRDVTTMLIMVSSLYTAHEYKVKASTKAPVIQTPGRIRRRGLTLHIYILRYPFVLTPTFTSVCLPEPFAPHERHKDDTRLGQDEE